MISNASDSARDDSLPAPFSRQVWLAPLLLMLLLLATECGGEPLRGLLRYDRVAIESGQWWRLLTGNFVHLGWYHWMLNEIGIAVLVLLCPQPLSIGVLARRITLIGLAMSGCLYFFVPNLHSYVGMSGVIHGLFVLGLLPQVLRRDLISLGCMLFLIGKLSYELFAGAPVSDEAAIGGSVVTESHFWGAVAAFVYAAIFDAWRGRERFA
jgi:rhomboid family GlyGly-CTERM serine protease